MKMCIRICNIVIRKAELKIIGIVLSVIIAVAVPFAIISKAYSTSDEKVSYKYYTYYTVSYGDTLESIAEQYYDSEHYTIASYIHEVAGINSLSEHAHLRTGSVIAIPYYSEEYVY
ncbi:MAG: LysM peptidoglycan-binding domain-containing protein [Lachnospiraceae bacterium]|nr:LysM peptidoglycan-binding domain-containing protein [Lachnospiraceae bacterium]